MEESEAEIEKGGGRRKICSTEPISCKLQILKRKFISQYQDTFRVTKASVVRIHF